MKTKTKYESKESIEQYINALQNYQGYVQFSDTKIREKEDIFKEFQNIKITPPSRSSFIYEAHFFNGEDSLSIKQVNSFWFVDELKKVDIGNIKTYEGIFGLKIKMAQIWEAVEDEFCSSMEVKKLKKVVFTGFKGSKPLKKEIESKEEPLSEKTLLSDLTQEHKEKLLNKFLSIYNDEYIQSLIDEVRSEK